MWLSLTPKGVTAFPITQGNRGAMTANVDIARGLFKLDADTIGQRIREGRTARGMTQLQVGKACGLSQNSVMKIETGRSENSRFVTDIWAHLAFDIAELSDVYLPKSEDEQALLRNGLVQVNPLPRKAHLLKKVTYELVHMPEVGTGVGMMITWTVRNGAMLSAVMDRSMVPEAAAEFARLARELGFDLKTPAQTESPEEP